MFRRSIGQEIRAWPMLALLAVIVVVAIGCVLWFMREAMRNERIAVREKLAEAYRGQLALLRASALEKWSRWLEQLDGEAPDAAHFARCIEQGLAESVICFSSDGTVAYPAGPEPPAAESAVEAGALQNELRNLANAGRASEAVRLIEETFAEGGPVRLLDGEGRLVAASAELMALELIGDPAEPQFQRLAGRLAARVSDYRSTAMPSAQRRFIMRELVRLQPERSFPTLAAEDLAARYLEAHSAPGRRAQLLPTQLPGIWSVAAPSGRVLALITPQAATGKLTAFPADGAWPSGVRVAATAPGHEPEAAAVIATLPLEPALPGWRLALSLDDRASLNDAADKRVARHLTIGSVTVAALSLLALVVARGLGQQVKLARLKNDLVATVSHELKTPLTAMRALVDTLIESERLDEKTTRDYLQLLAQENARLSRLIENFLTFSRLQRNRFVFTFSRIEPETISRAAVAALMERPQAEGCTFDANAGENLPPIRGDVDALTTALVNLLDNACKYSGDVKRITLRTEARNGHVRFAVTDNGVGLAPGETKRIFRRFYQVDQRLSRVAGGCGLGLSIVQSIVEAHGGAISVESEVGRGSTFTMEIPALTETKP